MVKLNIESSVDTNNVNWTTPAVIYKPFTWYKTKFKIDANIINDNGVLLLDIGNSMNVNTNGINRECMDIIWEFIIITYL